VGEGKERQSVWRSGPEAAGIALPLSIAVL
jgi:hypothetical protein